MTTFERAFRIEQEIKRQDIWFEGIEVIEIGELEMKHAHPLEDEDYIVHCMFIPYDEDTIQERIDEVRILEDDGYLNIIAIHLPNEERNEYGWMFLEPTRKALRLPKHKS